MARMQIAQMSFAKVYPLLVQKAERKGRTKEEVDQVLFWLTGYFTCHLLQSILCLSCKANFAPSIAISRGRGTMRSRIRELRRAQKLSQAELADAVGTTRQTITSIEVGKYTASLPLAYKIARYFGLTIEEVFDFSEIDEEL